MTRCEFDISNKKLVTEGTSDNAIAVPQLEGFITSVNQFATSNDSSEQDIIELSIIRRLIEQCEQEEARGQILRESIAQNQAETESKLEKIENKQNGLLREMTLIDHQKEQYDNQHGQLQSKIKEAYEIDQKLRSLVLTQE